MGGTVAARGERDCGLRRSVRFVLRLTRNSALMPDGADREMAELLLAVAASPGGRATAAAVAESVQRPLGDVSRRLRDAQRAGLVASAVTLSAQPGRDRVYWLTADKGLSVLVRANGRDAAPDADAPSADGDDAGRRFTRRQGPGGA